MDKFNKFKEALKKQEEHRWKLLKAEIKQVEKFIENVLTKIFESSAFQSRANYSGLEMY